ncbi:hypothetical protein ACVWZR_007218 [Bradyrhizobium sp. i1.3.1]
MGGSHVAIGTFSLSAVSADSLALRGVPMAQGVLISNPSAVPAQPHARDHNHPHPIARNSGRALEMDWVDDIRINLSAAERRVASLPGRRTVKKDAQAAWLLKAITCIDLTTLNGDDTAERVKRLCAKARAPIRSDLLEALGFAGRRLHTGRDLRLSPLRRNRGRSARWV